MSVTQKSHQQVGMLFRTSQWHPTPVLLPGKSHGWRSLVGCSPWGRQESDMTEWLHFHFSLSCIGEGNGNPLRCSCLENPRDGGAWWAAVYGVAQSRTQLKWLSSSINHIRGIRVQILRGLFRKRKKSWFWADNSSSSEKTLILFLGSDSFWKSLSYTGIVRSIKPWRWVFTAATPPSSEINVSDHLGADPEVTCKYLVSATPVGLLLLNPQPWPHRKFIISEEKNTWTSVTNVPLQYTGTNQKPLLVLQAQTGKFLKVVRENLHSGEKFEKCVWWPTVSGLKKMIKDTDTWASGKLNG